MKKIIISVAIIVLVVAAYLGQVAYMATLNQKVFDLATQKNDFVSIEDVKFKKGFFTSNAEFNLFFKTEGADLLSLGLGQMPISVKVHFKNNVFAKDNLNIDIQNPLYELMRGILGDEATLDKVFANVKVDVSLFGNIKVNSKINDIDIKNDEFLLRAKNIHLQSKLNLKGRIFGSNGQVDELVASAQNYHKKDSVGIKNLHFEESIKQDITISEYLSSMLSPGNSKMSIDVLELSGVVLNKIQQSKSNTIDKEGLLTGSADLSVKNIVAPDLSLAIDDISAHYELGNLSLNFLKNASYLDDYTDAEQILMELLATNPVFELSNLSLNSNGKKFQLIASAKGSLEEYSLNLSAESEVLPSEILPILQLLNIDRHFVEKDGKYALDFVLTQNLNEEQNGKMILNGKDIDEKQAILPLPIPDENSSAPLPLDATKQ